MSGFLHGEEIIPDEFIPLCKLEGCPKKVYVDYMSMTIHEFCCEGHEQRYMNGHKRTPELITLEVEDDHVPYCALSGCQRKVYVDYNTMKVYDYCGKPHAMQDKQSRKRTREPYREQGDLSVGSPIAMVSPVRKKPASPPAPPSPQIILRQLYRDVSTILESLNQYDNELQDMHLLISPFIIAQYLVTNGCLYYPSPHSHLPQNNDEHSLVAPHYEKLVQLLKQRTLQEKFQKMDYDAAMTCLSIDIAGHYQLPVESIRDQFENFHYQEYACSIPGCTKRANISGFCSENHYYRGENSGYIPTLTIGMELALVSLEDDWSAHLMTNQHPCYAVIKDQFQTAWLHEGYDTPKIQRIYKLKVASHLYYRFEDLRFEDDRNDTMIMFHGTYHEPSCMFGKIPTARSCQLITCSVCSICRMSFSLLAKSRTGGSNRMALRYGPGLYFSPVSSKSHDYTNGRNYQQKFQLRSIFLSKIKIGRKYCTEYGFLHEGDCPPHGFDSVHGMAGKDLNYDEYVVYNEAQAIPTYLIFYSTKT